MIVVQDAEVRDHGNPLRRPCHVKHVAMPAGVVEAEYLLVTARLDGEPPERFQPQWPAFPDDLVAVGKLLAGAFAYLQSRQPFAPLATRRHWICGHRDVERDEWRRADPGLDRAPTAAREDADNPGCRP